MNDFIKWNNNFISNYIQFLPNEYWRPITNMSVPNVVPGMYYISNCARVYSTHSNKILAQIISNTGYYRVNLRHIDGSSRYHILHRILMIEFCAVPGYTSLQINHIDGKKTNNDFNNLEWCTCQQNIQHAYDTGLKIKEHGEDCTYATITNKQAEQIAQLITTQKYSHKEIATIVGCKLHIVNSISAGETWKYIYNKYELYKYKRNPRPGYTDEQIHQLCKFFENNKDNIKYKTRSDMFRDALKTLFDIEYDNSMASSLNRIYNKQTRKDITNQYNF